MPRLGLEHIIHVYCVSIPTVFIICRLGRAMSKALIIDVIDTNPIVKMTICLNLPG